jgi:hypothetical protein
VREHEIYVVGHHEGALQKAKDGMKDRASSTTPNARKSKTGTHPASAGTATVTLTIPSFVQDRKKLTMVAAGLGALVLVLGILVATKKPAHTEVAAASTPIEAKPVTPPANTGEPSKPVEVRAPESKVVLPPPPASQIPPAAPEPAKADAAKADAAKAEGKAAVKAAEAAKADAAKAAAAEKPAAPNVIPATLVFNVSPWGEIFVNGKSQGVTPPKKFIKLDPGKYKIEVRNTTFPAHVENFDLKARDEITVRHKFQ